MIEEPPKRKQCCDFYAWTTCATATATHSTADTQERTTTAEAESEGEEGTFDSIYTNSDSKKMMEAPHFL